MPDAVQAEGLIGGEERPEPDRLPRLIRSTWYIVSRRVEGRSNSRCWGRLHHFYYFAREPKPNSVALMPIFQLYAYALTVLWVELSIEESPGRRDVPDEGDIFTPRRAVRNPRWKPDKCLRRLARGELHRTSPPRQPPSRFSAGPSSTSGERSQVISACQANRARASLPALGFLVVFEHPRLHLVVKRKLRVAMPTCNELS
jgi:hypothetical protein